MHLLSQAIVRVRVCVCTSSRTKTELAKQSIPRVRQFTVERTCSTAYTHVTFLSDTRARTYTHGGKNKKNLVCLNFRHFPCACVRVCVNGVFPCSKIMRVCVHDCARVSNTAHCVCVCVFSPYEMIKGKIQRLVPVYQSEPGRVDGSKCHV